LLTANCRTKLVLGWSALQSEKTPNGSQSPSLGASACAPLLAMLAACAPKATPTAEPTVAEEQAPQSTGPQLETGHLTCLLCCGTQETHDLQDKFNAWFSETYPSITQPWLTAGQSYFEKLRL
jgi:hypothetical protein